MGFIPIFWLLPCWETQLLQGVLPRHPLPTFLLHPLQFGM